MIVELVRIFEAKTTLGILKIEKIPFCVVLELPDRSNKKNISCIPAPQQYYCQRVDSPKFGNTFEVVGVEDRSSILFHKGNSVEDTRGCLILGESFWKMGESKESRVVLNSGRTFARFLLETGGVDRFLLTIDYCL